MIINQKNVRRFNLLFSISWGLVLMTLLGAAGYLVAGPETYAPLMVSVVFLIIHVALIVLGKKYGLITQKDLSGKNVSDLPNHTEKI